MSKGTLPKPIQIAPRFYVVNPPNRESREYERKRYASEPNRFVLWLGAYGSTMVLVYAKHLEDALDETIDWCVDFMPGLLCDDSVNAEYERLFHEYTDSGLDEDAAREKAYEESEVDITRAGNYSNCIPSYEWGIVCENPSREELKGMIQS